MQVQTTGPMTCSGTGDSPGYEGGTVKQEVGDAAKKVAPVTGAGPWAAGQEDERGPTDVKEAGEATASCPGVAARRTRRTGGRGLSVTCSHVGLYDGSEPGDRGAPVTARGICASLSPLKRNGSSSSRDTCLC